MMKKMKFPKGRPFVCPTGVLAIMVLLTLISAYSTETLVATVKSETHACYERAVFPQFEEMARRKR